MTCEKTVISWMIEFITVCGNLCFLGFKDESSSSLL